jgi:hypothetical protein
MNRSSFIKKLLASFFGVALFPSLPAMAVSSKKIVVYEAFAAGYHFHKGKDYEDVFQSGQVLSLVREPENRYDDLAVAIYWRRQKIGYIRQDDNWLINKLLDQGVGLEAVIKGFDKASQPWKKMLIEVSIQINS